MKEKYLDLMEKALSAYPYEHIVRYFDEVKEKGLTEHGFPRLTADIGILISHGRRRDLLPIFLEMMEFCCKTIPTVKAANDFSVREMISCIWEVEKSGIVDAESLARWRGYLSTINPLTCYTRVATSMDYNYRNWVLFTALSEFFRGKDGLCDPAEFIEFQLQHQMRFFDENGMYLDNKKAQNHQPMVYDIVPRGLLLTLLDNGYQGAFYEQIDSILRKSALLTLDMQSPNGEYAFGGRSNQFIHNEGWLVGIFDYEAKRYTREGNHALAARFVAARNRAVAVMEKWLTKDPIRHIKNRYPTETSYGCEGYAYFDKYMITVASLIYIAYLVCDDSIPDSVQPDTEPCARMTSANFHKLFLKCGGYGLEFDTDADPHYDASGLGRIHRVDAPSTICISCPCPVKPAYTVDIEEPFAFSACAAIRKDGEWIFGADPSVSHEVISHKAEENRAIATLDCKFATGEKITESYSVDENGVKIVIEGEGEIGYALPAFCFDGDLSPEITLAPDGKSLSIAYQGWICRYTTDGVILDTGKIAANRNGHYRAFVAVSEKRLAVNVEILKA